MINTRDEKPHNNPEASRELQVTRDEDEEERAYWKLHPSVRRMLQDCPYEFSATDAQTIWEMCVGHFDSLATFKKVLGLNVAELRKKEAAIGVGPDIFVLPKYSLRMFDEPEIINENDSQFFDMYSIAPRSPAS